MVSSSNSSSGKGTSAAGKETNADQAKATGTAAAATDGGATGPEIQVLTGKPARLASVKSGAATEASSTGETGAESEEDHVFRNKTLISLVTERTDMPRSLVKKAVDAAMFELGNALRDNREMNLRGFGKLRVQRSVQRADAMVSVVKVRSKTPNPDAVNKDKAADGGTGRDAQKSAAKKTAADARAKGAAGKGKKPNAGSKNKKSKDEPADSPS